MREAKLLQVWTEHKPGTAVVDDEAEAKRRGCAWADPVRFDLLIADGVAKLSGEKPETGAPATTTAPLAPAAVPEETTPPAPEAHES